MLVKLKRKWFAPNSVRYRQADAFGPCEVPDTLMLDLPSDAEVEQLDGSWIRANELKAQIADIANDDEGGDDDDEDEGNEDKDQEEGEGKEGEDDDEDEGGKEEEPEDPSAAFKRELKESKGDAAFSAAQAAHTAAAKVKKSRKGKPSGKSRAKK